MSLAGQRADGLPGQPRVRLVLGASTPFVLALALRALHSDARRGAGVGLAPYPGSPPKAWNPGQTLETANHQRGQ